VPTTGTPTRTPTAGNTPVPTAVPSQTPVASPTNAPAMYTPLPTIAPLLKNGNPKIISFLLNGTYSLSAANVSVIKTEAAKAMSCLASRVTVDWALIAGGSGVTVVVNLAGTAAQDTKKEATALVTNLNNPASTLRTGVCVNLTVSTLRAGEAPLKEKIPAKPPSVNPGTAATGVIYAAISVSIVAVFFYRWKFGK
jgi:hypothetical protein